MLSRLGLLLVSVSLLACASHARAELTVSLRIPDDFPVGLPTIVSGELAGEVFPGTLLLLSHPTLGQTKVLAQHAWGSKQVWFPFAAHKEILGRQLTFQAQMTTGERTLGVKPQNIIWFSDVTPHVFSEKGREVLAYHDQPVTRGKYTRAGFIHPLLGLDREMFTEMFPADHPHHQGVFWAWHQLWLGDRKVGDPWVTEDHLTVIKQTTSPHYGPVFTTLNVEAEWTTPLLESAGQQTPIVEERTQIRLFKAVGDQQYVDLTIRLRACLPDVKIGGSEDVKGYSGFTVRVKPPKDMVIEDASGVRDKDAVQTTSPWADVYGFFAEGKTSGVAILSHPSLAQFPPRWLLRHYGMQNVAYPGREPVTLSTDKPLVIRHRLVLHRGNTKMARIAEHQTVYQLTP